MSQVPHSWHEAAERFERKVDKIASEWSYQIMQQESNGPGRHTTTIGGFDPHDGQLVKLIQVRHRANKVTVSEIIVTEELHTTLHAYMA